MTVTVSGMPSLSKSARMLVMASAAAETGVADASRAPAIVRIERRKTASRRRARWCRRVFVAWMGSPWPANIELIRLTSHLYTSLGLTGATRRLHGFFATFFDVEPDARS